MEVDLKLEPSGKYGVVVVGTYLIDAAQRLGVIIEDECGRQGKCDSCAVTITKGAELLSKPTKAELEHLSPERRKKGERLSCQAKIEKTGEICVMISEKAKPEESTFEKYQKEFSELPLDEKVKNLLSLESITLSETFNYILNLPYTLGAKIRDEMAEFGFKMEEAEKQAKRPAEHKTEEKSEEKAEASEPKTEASEPKAPKAKTAKATTAKKTTATAKKTTTRRRTAKTEDKTSN